MSNKQQPIVIALGGNALKADSHILDYPSLPLACQTMAEHADSGLLITHGNGPQIGNLAQDSAMASWPLDVLGAETEGLLGYVVEQELGNVMDDESRIATLLTRTEVRKDEKDFNKPVKPIGQWFSKQQADALAEEKGWNFLEENNRYRRLVPSPKPKRTLQLDSIKTLINSGFTVICAGGGGIPVIRDDKGMLHGLDAVIDKDYTSALLASELDARMLILATDVGGVYRDWEDGAQDLIKHCRPEELQELPLQCGSMAPKVDAACDFVRKTGSPAVIGALNNLHQLIEGNAGTLIQLERGAG